LNIDLVRRTEALQSAADSVTDLDKMFS